MYDNLNENIKLMIKDLGLWGLSEKDIIKSVLTDINEINIYFSKEDTKNSQEIKSKINKLQEFLLTHYLTL